MKKYITLFGVLMMLGNICCNAENRHKRYAAEVRFEGLRSGKWIGVGHTE
ncbi:MAG: hypothetical protein K2M07_03455 [Muribaculaceae bacterium]|nr:hypothetical protein [Muribaculaceae bacterium]